MKASRLVLIIAAGLCCSTGVAQTQHTRPATAAERIAMGFDDQTAVVILREAAATPSGPRNLAPEGGGPEAWYQTRIGTAFHGRTSEFTFAGEPPSIACELGSTEVFASATFDLPKGASIQALDLFGYDSNTPQDMTVYLLSFCQSTFDANPPTYTVHGSASTSGNPGNIMATLDLTAAPVAVDRLSCRYLARIRMVNSATGTCAGNSITLDKVRVKYTQP